MAINGGEIISYLDLDISKYRQGFAQANSQLLGFKQSNERLAGLAGAAGSAMMITMTAPFVAGAVMAAKAAISFESAFAGVKKTVDTTEAGYRKLKEDIMELAKETPATHSELAEIMESGGQLGVKEADLKKFTKTIADLGVATNLSKEAGASMIAQYANVKRMPLQEVDRFGSTIVALGNNTATTELDIMNMAQRLAGAADVVKLTDAQTLGLSATMASLGINAEAGGSAMSRILAKMDKAVKGGGKTLKDFAKIAKLKDKDFKELFESDALKALDAFINGLAEIKSKGGDIYSALGDVDLNDLRVADTLLRMSGAQGALAQNTELANKAWKENNALAKEAAQRYSTKESKIKLAKNSINESLIKIGGNILPVIAQGASAVAKFAEDFGNLDENMQRSILTTGGIVAAAGPAIAIVSKLAMLLGGPGGIALLATAAGAALYAMLAERASRDEAEELKKSLGGVKLEAEDMQAILKAGFPKPVVDTTELVKAQAESEKTVESFKNLYTELQKGTYNLRFNLEDPEALAQKAAGTIAAAQEVLKHQGAVLSAGIEAHFHDSPEKAKELGEIVSSWVSDNSEQLKKAGEALTKTILDNTLTGRDKEEAIRKGIAAINEIVLRTMAVNGEADMQAFLGKWKHSGLDADSFKAFSKELENVVDKNKASAEEAYKVVLRGLAELKEAGKLNENEYQAQLKAANEQYGVNLTTEELRGVKLAYDALAQDRVDQMEKAIALVKKHRADMENDAEYANYGYNDKRTDVETKIWELIRSADSGWKYIEPFYLKLEKMKESGVTLTGEIADIYDNLSKLKTVRYLNNGFEDLYGIEEDKSDRYKEQGKKNSEAYAEGQQEKMGEKKSEIEELYKAPDVSGSFESMANNAADAFISALKSRSREASDAGAAFGGSAMGGLKNKLEIRSPSRVTTRFAMHTADGYINQLKREKKRATKSGAYFGENVLDGMKSALTSGSQKAMDNFKLEYNGGPGFRRAGGGLPKLNAQAREHIAKQNRAKSYQRQVQGPASQAAPQSWSFNLPSRDEISRLDGIRERLLKLSGAHRAYYDETRHEKDIKAIDKKWKALIEKEEEGFRKLDDAQQTAQRESFNSHMQKLREMRAEELELVKKNYEIQKNMAVDFLEAQASSLTASYEAERKQAQKEEAEKEKAELKKRIRQSRSARERRELKEELERLEKNEALDRKNEELQARLSGLNALKNAVNKGIIGLGALMGNGDFYTGSGLKTVQGATSENLGLALKAIMESTARTASQGGNHYTIDLSGAVIRDDKDINRIVDEFDRITRSRGRAF